MGSKIYLKFLSAFFMLLLFTVKVFPQAPVPTLTGPEDPSTLMPATLSSGVTADQVYFTESGMSNYVWAVSTAGTITNDDGNGIITVTWTDPTGQQSVSVSYTDPVLGLSETTVLIINYYPFLPPIDPFSIPQFVDPLPHFAAGLRVNAKAGGNLVVKAVPVQQVALSTGTEVGMPGGGTGIIGTTPNAGKGNYAAYAISTDNGTTFGPAMWPAQTIEAQQGNQLTVKYLNELNGTRYSDFNILADQTLMMNGYTLNGNELIDPYDGPIPMVVHLHGGEMPSGSDGGPNAWFMPTGTSGVNTVGPGFPYNASDLSVYPNQQEATTLWYHPHDDGLTRINVYTGLAGYYFLRGADEEAAQLPGWSGDNMVQEVTPAGKAPTFNGTNTYLPEVEIAIQDRMFNVNGELYWPVAPTNPDIHPFWTPEFNGDVMTVNGKSWPYLSVAPRKYRFRMLEGCNARFLNMWLENAADGTKGPVITVIGGEGGLLSTPVPLDPALGKTLLMAPGQRYDVVVDFTGLAGNTYTLMNDANSPYPFGDPVIPGATDRIMQFVVNGTTTGIDNSQLPVNLRPVTPLVKLTDFAGAVDPAVTPAVKRQLILNEVSTADGGPASVLVNNAYFESALAIPGTPTVFGDLTEIPREGTTEIYQIINISADAHPIHIHLLQWQLVSRQAINDAGYMDAYVQAWAGSGMDFPAGMGYPGGAGSPLPYETVNADGAIGGNPAVSPYLVGAVIPANPEEQGWKDNVIVLPGEVTTFITRVAPTDRPINATPAQLMFPFDPSEGPGFVWHCHIVDHEDMSMMRPLHIAPSVMRFPQITNPPQAGLLCEGGTTTLTVNATSATPMTYIWEVSIDNGATWTPLADGGIYSGVLTNALTINPLTVGLTNNQYHAVVTNSSGTSTSAAVLLTVNPLPVPTFTADPATTSPTACLSAKLVYTTDPGMTNYVWTFTGVLNVDYAIVLGGTALTNTVTVQWLTPGVKTVSVSYTNAKGCTAAAATPSAPLTIVAKPAKPGMITGPPAVCSGLTVVYSVPPVAGLTYIWTYSGTGVNLAQSANSVSVEFLPTATSGTLRVTASNACGASPAQSLSVTVNKVPLAPAKFILSKTTVCKTQSKVMYSVPKVSGVTYNWSFTPSTGVTITGGTSNTVTLSFLNATVGVGTLSVTATNACGTGPALTLPVTISNCVLKDASILTGNEELASDPSINELKVFPNPTSGAVTFEFRINVDANVTIDISSIVGAHVYRIFDADVMATETQSVLFDKPILPGVYFYTMRWNDQTITGKFIKTE